MAPIAKENEVLTATTTETAPRPTAAATLPGEGGNKPQPVALEVPVSVNGARTVEGSDKREPFSESTKTVLVFGNGAVIRLQSPVAPGQLLFLTNEKTKKEVVCQVVKSKNYRNVSGYVELEFTEAVVGFWGMRFPGDRIGAQAPAAGTPGTPIAPKTLSQPVGVAAPPKAAAPSAPKTDAAANFNALKALSSSTANTDLPRTPDTNVAPPVAKAQPPVETFEVKPAATVPPPVAKETASVASDPSTEALKQQAARLQEQLATLMFAEKANVSAPPAAATKDIRDTASKILEFVKPETTQPPVVQETPKNVTVALPKTVQPIASVPAKSVLDSEEVKIPSWLAPLARNAADASAEDATTKEESWHGDEPILESHIALEPVASAGAPSDDAEAPALTFETSLLGTEHTNVEGARHSNKGILIGAIAAGLLLAAAGGAWFVRNQSATAQTTAPGALVNSPAVVQPSVQTPTANVTGSQTNSVVPTATAAPVSSPTYAATGTGGLSVNTGNGNTGNPAVSNAVVKTSQPIPEKTSTPVQIQPQPKKPALGEVRLAAPTLNRTGQTQSGGETDPGISLGNSQPAPDSLGSGLESHSKGPVAPAEPLPIGGDVRPAKLVTSVSPVYPSLAKAQHVSGDVKVDALIDANGKVTTMKVVSGPTLLQQSAMDALRQWKYQPATLDGKAVSMHLTVTLQFRLQ